MFYVLLLNSGRSHRIFCTKIPAFRATKFRVSFGYEMKKMLALQKYHKTFENCKSFKVKPIGIKEKICFLT